MPVIAEVPLPCRSPVRVEAPVPPLATSRSLISVAPMQFVQVRSVTVTTPAALIESPVEKSVMKSEPTENIVVDAFVSIEVEAASESGDPVKCMRVVEADVTWLL